MKWAPYGLSFLKPVIYKQFKGRPVLYLSDEEYRRQSSPRTLLIAWPGVLSSFIKTPLLKALIDA